MRPDELLYFSFLALAARSRTFARFACVIPLVLCAVAAELPANRWIELRKDPTGARRASAIRYAPEAHAFFLWGFMNADANLLQEQPLMETPEYDMAMFDPDQGLWRNHLPVEWERQWSKRLPLAYVPRTYSGITTGSERTVMRGNTNDRGGAPRPDLNMVFDQVVWHPGTHSLIYFTGGLTAAYDVSARRWRDLAPKHSPPPVQGGSLALAPFGDTIVLFGGGHVAEPGPNGKVVGYTGTWIYDVARNDWQLLPGSVSPPPRMNMRVVCDTRNRALVVFGGDGQTHYLADTWIFDFKTWRWRQSQARGGPEARAGHFTAYDPETGLIIVGGGYNRADLSDMWGYDAAKDGWTRLEGDVPAGFYLSADIAPEKRLLVLVTATSTPGDRATCNVLFPVRTTYGYRIETTSIVRAEAPHEREPIPKRERADLSASAAGPPPLANFPVNQWVQLPDRGWVAPARTWGSASFDNDRERILYWGGGHCGYGGSDVDAYDPAAQAWVRGAAAPDYPERAWNNGVRLAGVTFSGAPWTDHGRRIYAYDPVSRRMIMVRSVRLTTGYDPGPLHSYPARATVAPDALIRPPSSYERFVTWTYDPDTHAWAMVSGAPAGLDTLVTTPLGVMGINVNWPGRLNDAGYQIPWDPSQSPEDNAIYLYHAAEKRWERLSKGLPSPQNLYEMTSLAWDSKRKQVILHGGGQRRNELWTFDFASRRWTNRNPRVVTPAETPPACGREAVYVPDEDVFLTFTDTLWAYRPGENTWRRTDVRFAGAVPKAGQNRAMVYDDKRGLSLLVLGESVNEGKASVYALRYRN